MKTLKLFLALAGTALWGAFAIFMNDMNSASDLDHSTGLVRLSLVGVFATLWLIFWVGLTWFLQQEARMAGHLRIVVAFLWANSLVLEIGLPWLAYLAGWMWPSSLTAGFQTLLIASAFCMHLLTCTQNVHKRTYPYVLGFGFLASTFLVIYVHLKSFADIHDLPYQSMVF
jgi:hypothetical protein